MARTTALDPSHSPKPAHPFVGRMLGDFLLTRELASGGMATIFLAHRMFSAGAGQPAAIKVIHPHLAHDRDFVDMFLDEARLILCLNHPNVCGVLDFGRAEDTYFLAMEYVLGETLHDVLQAMKQTQEAQEALPSLMLSVVAQACEGLHAAHTARDSEDRPLGIVHRDVSPQNLIVGYDGIVRVLDFGIARANDQRHTTRDGTIKGRFAYMAPEQMRGLAVDHRADIWSLGVVLWEGLARRRLFKRETEAETILAVTHDPLPPLPENLPFFSPITQILESVLCRESEARFQNARELGVQLSNLIGTRKGNAHQQLGTWMQRLFPERIAQKRNMLRDARRAAQAVRPRHSSLPPLRGALPALIAQNLVMPSISHVRERSYAEGIPLGGSPTLKRIGDQLKPSLLYAAIVLTTALVTFHWLR